MYGFLAGFGSSKSILADQNDFFLENCNLKKWDEVARA